jgi:hypothetical protein
MNVVQPNDSDKRAGDTSVEPCHNKLITLASGNINLAVFIGVG